MPSRAAALAALAVVVIVTGCAGSSELERCVDHSVEEGVDRVVAQQACERALDDVGPVPTS